MIVVTGATGHYGAAVVEQLLKTLPAAQLAVSVRDPQKASALAERGVRVRRGDFADPGSLAEAFADAEQVLIVSVNAMGEAGVRQHGAAIDAAKHAGATRILYTSHSWRGAHPIFAASRENHEPTEQLLHKAGVPFVALRNGFYAESALFQLQGLKHTGKIALPADGPVDWTVRNDLAEAAARVLLDPGLLEDGISPPLTGPELLDFAGIARLAGEILGKDVPREVTSDHAFKQAVVSQGVPAHIAELLVTLYTAARAGEFAELDPTLERVLGRRPKAMRTVLEPFLSGPETKIFQ